MKYLVIVLLFPCILFSQTNDDKRNIQKNTNDIYLNKLAERQTIQFYENKKRAETFAKIFNWDLTTFKDSVFSELIDITTNLKPIYVSTFNKGAGITSRANKLHSGGSLGLNINGENMTAAVWDAGSGMPNHELFSGRMTIKDAALYSHFHSAHVAGTLAGSELFQNGNAKGMAPRANLDSYDWLNDKSEIAVAAAGGLLVSSHSYGKSPNWLFELEWGKYDPEAQICDDIMFNAPYYQMVCAAGNSRGSFNTLKNGFDTLSGFGLSKNGITVGAVNEVLNYTNSSSVEMPYFSSWGPTDDGRIKPDICSKGVNTFSSTNATTSSYTTLSGTSMASPSIAGTLLLLQQYYKQLNNSFMKASTLRGLMIHTADEAGTSAGPDYSFGWGLINAEKAADIIKKNQVQSQILENTLNNNTLFALGVNALGTEPLIATLCWTDPKGNLPDIIIDSSNPNLVNDLDIRITQNNNVTFPWKLNPANAAGAAVRGDNTVDNVEKIQIDNPSGTYSISVRNKGILSNNYQNYSLIISGIIAKDFWITGTENSKSICDNINSLNYAFNLRTKSNFSDVVTLSTLNLPAGITATFSSPSLSTAGIFGLTLTNLAILIPGVYYFTVKGISAADSYETQVILTVLSATINTVVKIEPTNNSISNLLPASFSWVNDINAQSYDLEIATDINFTTIIESVNVVQNNFLSTLLANNTTYFWRVKSKNACGTGNFSIPFRFSTVCGLPYNIAFSNATTSSGLISWSDTFSPNSWEIEIVPQGTNPSGVGTIVTNNSYPINGLAVNSCYNFYVRAICGAGTSAWTLPFTFCTLPDYCGGDHFYDTGGLNGNYQNNENYIKTIYPQVAGQRVKAVFNSFNLEKENDFLSVYNGPDINAPLLFSGTGTYIPNVLASTNTTGSLTFRFNSDQITTKSGWDATIICEPLPTCPLTPNTVAITNINYTTAYFNWIGGLNIISSEIEIVPRGAVPTGVGIISTARPYLATNLTSNTKYDFYVRSFCAGGNSDWSMPFQFTTKANYCAGDHFTDNAGPNANYAAFDDSVTTIAPANFGDRVKLNFSSFALISNSYFVVYNGTNDYGEILYEFNGTNPPTTVKSTSPDGAVTVLFVSSSANTASGWDASVICEPMPPCPRLPKNLSVIDITTNSARFNWIENSGATQWEIEIVPHNTSPTGLGFITNNRPYSNTTLTSNTWYDFYVRSVCGGVGSDWAKGYTFHTKGNYCAGDHFYDDGGPLENYVRGSFVNTTINPSGVGNRVKAIFNSFEITNNSEFSVYNGPDNTYPRMYYSGSGNPAPATLTATNPQGALTFYFYTTSYATAAGWDATIVCEPLPPCGSPPSNIILYNTTQSTATFNWNENSNANQWDVEIVPNGTNPTGSGIVTTTKPFTKNGLTPSVIYDFYVRSKCGTENSDWTGPFVFSVLPDYCAGDHFYDSGGASGNYAVQEYYNKIIYPENSGDRIKAVFNTFELNSGSRLQVYNSAYSIDSSFLIFDSNSNASPGTLLATNAEGALNFVFSTYNQITGAGWDATIICEPLPVCAAKPTNLYVSEIEQHVAKLVWFDNSNATTWEIEVSPTGTTPSGIGIIVDSNPYIKNGLNSFTTYDFRVRSKCGMVNSEWSIPSVFTTEPDYCAGDHFYDNGGPNGNYFPYNQEQKTIYPSVAGERVKAFFNSFQLGTNDFFSIHNGPNANAPVIFFRNSGNLTIPTTVSATNPQGALTFQFNSSQANPGWDATIICEPLPLCASFPTGINYNNITTSSATFGWIENSNAMSWEIEIVPQNAMPTGAGIIVNSNPYTAINLASNTWYDFYIRSKCGTAVSPWTEPIKFSTKANYCAGDHYYDEGGPNGNYSGYSNYYKTIYPTVAGNRIKAIFNSFQLTSSDAFAVYDGIDSSAPLIFSYNTSNQIIPSTITATNLQGALFFTLSTDSGISNGWDATIICEPLPPCAAKPSFINNIDTTINSATFNWTENSNATAWEIEIVLRNMSATGTGIIVNSNTYLATNLISNSNYDFYIRSRCINGNSDWTGPIAFSTKANYCGGDHFYDNGGPNGNYLANVYESKIITPENAGDRVKATFNTFNLNINDTFTVYDGLDYNNPVLFSKNVGYLNIPTSIVATNQSGALSIYFNSSAQTNSGWDATIVCEPIPPCAIKPTNLGFIDRNQNTAKFIWTENANATSWEIEIVPENTAPTGFGIIVNSNPYIAVGLNSNTWYNFYIRSTCGNLHSAWSGPLKFSTAANYCSGDHFYDDGGPNGNYGIYNQTITTINPLVVGERVKAIFNSFAVNDYDNFIVYDGQDTSASIIFSRDVNNLSVPTTLKATNPQGALTFYFYTSYQANLGWDATITCEPIPPCTSKPNMLLVDHLTQTTANVGWTENSNSTLWEILVLPINLPPSNTGLTVNTNPFTLTNLIANNCYDVYVKSICGTEKSEWSAAKSFCTTANYCIGEHFYDSGGATSNYSNNEYYLKTIYPDNPDNKVKVTFNTFSLQNNFDVLQIYDGPNLSSPLIYFGSGSNSPGIKTSTHATGALTFYFVSNSSITYAGWDATITCAMLSNNENEIFSALKYYPNPVTNLLHINTKENVESFEVFDINMRVIMSEKINANNFDIDLATFSAGAYFVKLTNIDGNSKKLKILKN